MSIRLVRDLLQNMKQASLDQLRVESKLAPFELQSALDFLERKGYIRCIVSGGGGGCPTGCSCAFKEKEACSDPIRTEPSRTQRRYYELVVTANGSE